MSEAETPRHCAPGDGAEGGYIDKQKDPMSEETPKKKGRGPNSTAAGDPLIYTDASGIKWPGRHVRFNKGKTMKLSNGKQVACTITVRLDGQSNTSVVNYHDVTYLPKPGKESAAERNAPPSIPEHLKQYPLLPKDVAQPPADTHPPKWVLALAEEGMLESRVWLLDDAGNRLTALIIGIYTYGVRVEWELYAGILPYTGYGNEWGFEDPGMDRMASDLIRAADPIEQNQPPIWRSVHDVVDETDVVWDNELQAAYVMVDSSTGEVFTYEVGPEIQSLADLQDLMQHKGWQLGGDILAKYDKQVAEQVMNLDHMQAGFSILPISAAQPPIKVYTIADRGGNEIATYIPASDQFIIHGSHDPGDPMASHVAAQKFETEHGDRIKDFIRRHSGGTTIYLFSEEDIQAAITKAAGGANAAEPTVDAQQVDRAAEEPKTVPTEMLALRWNDEILGPERLGYRIPGRQHIYGDRHYVIQTPGDNVVFAPGVTSILKATMPKPEELFKWAVEKFRSWEEYQRHMTLAQGKGSVVHGAIADAINGVLPDFQDTAAWLSYLAAACSRNGCKGVERDWLGIVQRSVASIRQWAADHKVVFLMVEKALYTPSGFAGQIDFLVEMDSHIQNVKSTKAALREAPRRIIAIVDLKTGNDSDQYPAQLAYYRKLLLEGFPHIKKVIAERYPDQLMGDGNHHNIPLYLLFPKTGWRKSPTYSFLDRTLKADEYAANEMQHHIELFKFKRRKPAGVTRLTGPANFNTTNDGVLSYTSLEDVWKDKIAQGDLEPVEDINEEDEAD